MSILTAKDLSLGYDSVTVAEHINFTVNEGDYLGIVGENGSGKSTLMKTILGLTEPVSGQIQLEDGFGKRDIGYLPQQTQVQRDFPASVWEIVLSGCRAKMGRRFFYSSSEKELAMENLHRMGIEGLKKRSYRELSGGQQQRVLLARALCATEKVLLLDEPVSGLDPKATAEMYELVQKLNSEGVTIIMISHDIEPVLAYASHILHIGHKCFFGTTGEYLESGLRAMFKTKGEV
jgi:zinc transport system ATP-binding protein